MIATQSKGGTTVSTLLCSHSLNFSTNFPFRGLSPDLSLGTLPLPSLSSTDHQVLFDPIQCHSLGSVVVTRYSMPLYLGMFKEWPLNELPEMLVADIKFLSL